MKSTLYYILCFIYTCLIFVLMVPVFIVTYPFDRERVVLHHISRFWSISTFFLCPLLQLKVDGLENVDSSKPWVIITNHQSMIDVPLMYVLPLNFKWVSKKEVLKIPIFGLVLRMHGDIAIQRGSTKSAREMMRLCTERLNNNTSVIIFPEGTRSKDGNVGKFKDGAFALAKSAGVGILPVVAEGTGSLMNGWQVRMPHTLRVRALRPISAQEVANTEIKELTAKTQELMSSEHKKLI